MSDIFEQAATAPQVEGQQDVATPQPTEGQSVGVEYNGKIWTQEEILRKFESADSHIARIEEENKSLAEKVLSATTLDQVISKIEGQTEQPKPAEPTTTPVAEVDVETVALNAYQKMKQKEQMENNLAVAVSKMSEKFGDKTIEALREKAAELDMTLDEAKQLAMTKPKAFEKVFIGGTPAQQPLASSSGNVNTQTLNNKGTTKPTKSINKMSSAELVARALELAKTTNG